MKLMVNGTYRIDELKNKHPFLKGMGAFKWKYINYLFMGDIY